jgi:hypothetical protein
MSGVNLNAKQLLCLVVTPWFPEKLMKTIEANDGCATLIDWVEEGKEM